MVEMVFFKRSCTRNVIVATSAQAGAEQPGLSEGHEASLSSNPDSGCLGIVFILHRIASVTVSTGAAFM